MRTLSLLETKTKGFLVQIEIEDDDDVTLQNTNSLELAWVVDFFLVLNEKCFTFFLLLLDCVDVIPLFQKWGVIH
jgi:hypothetical protein